MKIQMKPRPQSALISRFKQNYTVQLQDQNFVGFVQKDNGKTISISNRAGLNDIIPQMPAFNQKNNKSTAILYSKFVMKGINKKKVDLVKQSFNLRRQKMQNDKKLAMQTIINKKSTRHSQITQKYNINDKKSKYQKVLTYQQKYSQRNQNGINFEINNFFHLNTHINKNNENKIMNDNQDNIDKKQNKLNYSKSQHVFKKRPKTAKNQQYNNLNFKNRPHTASVRKDKINKNDLNIIFPQNNNSHTNNNNNFNQYSRIYRPLSASKLGSNQKIQTIHNNVIGQVNFIQRNKRQLSASTSKNSLYLTGLDNININTSNLLNNQNNNGKKLFQKISSIKFNKTMKINHNKQQSTVNIQQEQQNNEEIRQDNLLPEQIQNIKQKQIQRKLYMKQNMPAQFMKYLQFVAQQQNGTPQMILLSKNLQGNQLNQIQQMKIDKNQQQIIRQCNQYYQDFAGVCEQTEYKIKKIMQKKTKTKSFNQILDIISCQKILQMQKQRQKLLKQFQNNQLLGSSKQILTQINLNIYNIVKILIFFKQKSQQMCNKLFNNLLFDIVSYEQDQVIIQTGQQIKYFYIILYGSVVKNCHNKINNKDYLISTHVNNNNCLITTNQQSNFNFNCTTYVDGESFGQPDGLFDKQYKYRIISQQKSLILRFPYILYRNLCAQNQNITNRIQFLKNIFGTNSNRNKIMNDEMLQILAFQLQSRIYQAKQLIFRQGQNCHQLIFLSTGKIALVKQHILKRQKNIQKDIKKKQKGYQNKIQLKNYTIHTYRRNFLNNYEVLDQNNQKIIFYYQDISKQFIGGDVVNWQVFQQYNNNSNSNNALQQKDLHDNKKTKNNSNKSKHKQKQQYKINYSLISNIDNTQTYILNMNKFQKLPQDIKQILIGRYQQSMQKIKINKKKPKKASSMSNIIVKNQFIDNIQKWDKYKQKLCQNVIKSKLKM